MSQPRLGLFVTQDLLNELNELFPARCARPGMSLEEIWIEAGCRKVIDKMTQALKDSEANLLSS
jgi:hypothetical protein